MMCSISRAVLNKRLESIGTEVRVMMARLETDRETKNGKKK